MVLAKELYYCVIVLLETKDRPLEPWATGYGVWGQVLTRPNADSSQASTSPQCPPGKGLLLPQVHAGNLKVMLGMKPRLLRGQGRATAAVRGDSHSPRFQFWLCS